MKASAGFGFWGQGRGFLALRLELCRKNFGLSHLSKVSLGRIWELPKIGDPNIVP